MKHTLPLLIAATLLASGCDKLDLPLPGKGESKKAALNKPAANDAELAESNSDNENPADTDETAGEDEYGEQQTDESETAETAETTAPAAPAQPVSENIAVVLDASGSMMGRIQGRTKIDIARDVVGNLVLNWQPQNKVALLAYGHNRKGDCNDIETLISLGPMDAENFMGKVRSLQPKGMTPLSQAVINAAEDLKYSENKATVVLVSDGEETCRLDPCEVGKRLEASGVDFTAHVIGFDVSDPKHQAQLRCLAENTGGRYFNASNADELNEALQEAVAPPEPPKQPEARLSGPAEVMGYDLFEFQAFGPQHGDPNNKDPGDYNIIIQRVGVEGFGYGGFNYTRAKAAAGDGRHWMHASQEPGDYELRYVRFHQASNQTFVLATHPIKVLPIEVRFDVAASYPADTRVTIPYSGPTGGQNKVEIYRAGQTSGAVRSARLENNAKAVEIRTPKEPGDYDIVYTAIGLKGQFGRTRIRVVAK